MFNSLSVLLQNDVPVLAGNVLVQNNCFLFSSFLISGSAMEYCTQNIGTIRPHPVNCALYIDCSADSIKDGVFIRECPYPQLFSVDSMKCQDFSSVTCQARRIPKAPCKLFQCTKAK